MNETAQGGTTLNLRNPFGAAGKADLPRTELEKAKAEAQAARAQAAAAVENAERLRANLLRSKRDAKVRLRITAAIMMTAALLKIAWQAAQAPAADAVPLKTQPLAASAALNGVNSSDRAFKDSAAVLALERVRTAFHAFPEEDQVDLVREVNQTYAGIGLSCPLEWRDGVPILRVGDPPSMAAALNQCAAGVERLRADRDAEKAH
jgi:hypothetical protein